METIDEMPLLDHGQLRKRWRYVALFAEELMLCAARAEVGPLTQSFWVLWDRETRQQWAHTALRGALIEGREELLAFKDIATLRAAGVERPADAPTDWLGAAAAAQERGMKKLAARLEALAA